MKMRMDELASRAAAELCATATNTGMAYSSARGLVLAESQGQGSHGLPRRLQYTAQLRNCRVDGGARAQVAKHKGKAVPTDADEGLAFPARELAVSEAVAVSRA